eukprot:4034792-Prymnesium_polylepis.1
MATPTPEAVRQAVALIVSTVELGPRVLDEPELAAAREKVAELQQRVAATQGELSQSLDARLHAEVVEHRADVARLQGATKELELSLEAARADEQSMRARAEDSSGTMATMRAVRGQLKHAREEKARLAQEFEKTQQRRSSAAGVNPVDAAAASARRRSSVGSSGTPSG